MMHVTLIDIENGFRSLSRKQVLKGCLGTIGGMHFLMSCPGKSAPNSYRHTSQIKHKFTLLRLAYYNSNRKFSFLDCSKCSNIHDSIDFYGTNVK